MIVIGTDPGGTNIKTALFHREKGFFTISFIRTTTDSGKNFMFGRIAIPFKKPLENHNEISEDSLHKKQGYYYHSRP